MMRKRQAVIFTSLPFLSGFSCFQIFYMKKEEMGQNENNVTIKRLIVSGGCLFFSLLG